MRANEVRDKFYELTGLGLDSGAVRNFFSNPEPGDADRLKVKATLQFADKAAKIQATENGRVARGIALVKMAGGSGEMVAGLLEDAIGKAASKPQGPLASSESMRSKRKT